MREMRNFELPIYHSPSRLINGIHFKLYVSKTYLPIGRRALGGLYKYWNKEFLLFHIPQIFFHFTLEEIGRDQCRYTLGNRKGKPHPKTAVMAG